MPKKNHQNKAGPKSKPKNKADPKPKRTEIETERNKEPPLDPVTLDLPSFAEKLLDVQCWQKMREIFDLVERGERKILVRSCNGAGKTTALAAICNWYFTHYDDSIVLTTASSWIQVRRNLWGEIRRQARKGRLYLDKDIIRGPTSVQASDKHFMIGISPNIPENAMGFHAPHMLIAVDEATGIDHEIVTALLGNLSSTNSQIVMICNPIDKDSYPYEAERSGEWKVVSISAFDHPNVVENCEVIPGAVTREWIEDSVRAWSFEVTPDASEPLTTLQIPWTDKWYRSNAPVQARILGEWAQLESAGFIPIELIERNVRKTPSLFGEPHHQPSSDTRPRMRVMGVDISRGVGRDATIYAYFDVVPDGPDVQRQFLRTYGDDLMRTADRIRTEYENAKAQGIELVIALDDTGLGGGVSDRLKRIDIPFFPVNFCQRPHGFIRGKDIANAKAEMFFILHDELLEGKIQIVDLPRFHQELSSIRLDVSKTSTAYKMEDKEETRKRLHRSPDYADATALARYALWLHKYSKKNWLL